MIAQTTDPASVIAGLSAGLYALAWLLFVLQRCPSARICLWAGWTVNLGLFAFNWAQAGAPPFGNMFHVQGVLALCMPVLYALLKRYAQLGWSGAFFGFAAALVMGGAAFMEPDAHWRRMPALQSPWFVPHVFAYMLSYALAALAFFMTVTRWVRRNTGRMRYRDAACRLIRLGFPFMTFGLLSGALWAEEAWGVYWSWDPKETWALITWTLYLIYLHCMHSADLRRYADVAHGLAFAALLVTFLVVNLLPKLASPLHGYA